MAESEGQQKGYLKLKYIIFCFQKFSVTGQIKGNSKVDLFLKVYNFFYGWSFDHSPHGPKDITTPLVTRSMFPHNLVVFYKTEQCHIAEDQNLTLTALPTLKQTMNAKKGSKCRVLLFL